MPTAGAPKQSERTARDDRPIPAAWPTGMARFGAVVTHCGTCAVVDECDRWVARSGEKPVAPPPFCPDPPDLVKSKLTRRG